MGHGEDEPKARERDACEVCHGERGGVPGNENIVEGVTCCDYCHADGSYKRLTNRTNPGEG